MSPGVTDWIGQWVARVTNDGAYLTRWHYVESVVADEPITRCGRRLAHRDGTAFLYQWDGSGAECARCLPIAESPGAEEPS